MPDACLICNGLSARGYQSPPGVFTVCINAGFQRHPCQAAFNIDCDVPRDVWQSFEGERIVAEHVPGYPRPASGPKDTRFECLELVRKYHSATPCALDWLHSKGYTKATVIGLDSLWGEGNPKAAYNANVVDMLCEMAQLFPEGLWVERCGHAVRVGSPEFDATIAEWRAKPLFSSSPAAPAPAPVAPPKPPAFVHPVKCAIPQTMVEFDVSPRCTRACKFCAPGIPAERRKQPRGLTLAAHNAVIDELRTLGYNQPDRWLCYCGHGEPGMHTALGAMIKYARRKLPLSPIALYTNTDTFTVERACFCEAQRVTVIADLYDEAAGPKLAITVAESSLDPASVHVVDHVKAPQNYSSRCSTVKAGDVKAWLNKPCQMPEGKLFITDDGAEGAAWLACCEDYGRKSLMKFEGVAKRVEQIKPLCAALAAGDRRNAAPICSSCDRDGGHPSGFAHVPRLTQTAYWPARPIPPTIKGKRLVVLACNPTWVHHAQIVLGMIAQASVMPGKTVLIWNADGVACPDALKMPGVTVWEYPQPLGRCGISRGFARAFQYALQNKYDWVIKLDTDTAIIRKGWDALLCADCPKDAQAGTYMDASLTGQFPTNNDKLEDGLFRGHIRNHVAWARNFERRGLRRWDHMQGGCYVIGRDALKRIDAVMGLDADDQEQLTDDALRVGEDVYIDTKCKLAKVPQRETLRARIWFRPGRDESVELRHIRHYRDTLGVVVVHPVKSLESLGVLAKEMP